jgi:hypothetical protein
VSSTGVARRVTTAVRDGLSAFLGIVGIVAIIIGLLYLFAHGAVPHVLLAGGHSRPHTRRAAACLIGGAACVVGAWLIKVRHRALARARPAQAPAADPARFGLGCRWAKLMAVFNNRISILLRTLWPGQYDPARS